MDSQHWLLFQPLDNGHLSQMICNLDTSWLTCLPTRGQLLAKISANMSTDTWPTDVDWHNYELMLAWHVDWYLTDNYANRVTADSVNQYLAMGCPSYEKSHLSNLDTSWLTCLPTPSQLSAKISANMSTDTRPTDVDWRTNWYSPDILTDIWLIIMLTE